MVWDHPGSNLYLVLYEIFCISQLTVKTTAFKSTCELEQGKCLVIPYRMLHPFQVLIHKSS